MQGFRFCWGPEVTRTYDFGWDIIKHTSYVVITAAEGSERFEDGAVIPDTLGRSAQRFGPLHPPLPTRVAVDGIDAAGKTRLADGIAGLVEAHERLVIRASLDAFHRHRAERYRQSAASPHW